MQSVQIYGEVIVKLLKTWLTPLRAFARMKIALFTALTLVLIGIKAEASCGLNRGGARFAMDAPEAEVMRALAVLAIVILLANIWAFREFARRRARLNHDILDLLRDPNIPESVKAALAQKYGQLS
jgi:hypothetical protein